MDVLIIVWIELRDISAGIWHLVKIEYGGPSRIFQALYGKKLLSKSYSYNSKLNLTNTLIRKAKINQYVN